LGPPERLTRTRSAETPGPPSLVALVGNNERCGNEVRLTTDTQAAIRAADFRAALRSFQRASERIARANALTPQRYLLLLMIKGAPDGSERTTVGELTERLQLGQSTVTELVNRAEEAGLIGRATSASDGRVVHLSLTAEGERRLAASFTSLESERRQLRQAFRHLEV
jgi:DNA-binding MarR family transcriptional regulator